MILKCILKKGHITHQVELAPVVTQLGGKEVDSRITTIISGN